MIGRTRLPNLFLNTAPGARAWIHACGAGKSIARIVSGLRPRVHFPQLAQSPGGGKLYNPRHCRRAGRRQDGPTEGANSHKRSGRLTKMSLYCTNCQSRLESHRAIA